MGLAPMLAHWNVTVYRLDLGYNECPPGALPAISAGYSGYFFVPRAAKMRGLKWQRLKKLDPPFDKVLGFVEKHSEAKPNAAVLLAELEAGMHSAEWWAAARHFLSKQGVHACVFLGLVGWLIFLLLLWWRWPSRHSTGNPATLRTAGPAAAGGKVSSDSTDQLAT